MSRIKQIARAIIAIVTCVALCLGVYLKSPKPEATSAMRELDYEGVLILDEDVPLGISDSVSVCMQALKLINAYRGDNGLGALLWSRDLEAAAAVRANEAGSCWSHTRPNGQPWYTVNPSIMYGENLGRGYDDADSLVAAWKASPAHNENLLYADFRYAAISKVGDCYALEFA